MSLSCDHDKRFSGVFFLPKEDNGCIACALERETAEVETKDLARKAALKTVDSLTASKAALTAENERLNARHEGDKKVVQASEDCARKHQKRAETLSAENERLKSQLDEFVYAEDNPTYESEAERLQKIIIKAYQHLGFTGQKNNTMRILGTGLPNRKDSEQKWRVSTEQKRTQNGNKDTKDPHVCPGCGGPADNGHDRCWPPNPYYCTKCERVGDRHT